MTPSPYFSAYIHWPFCASKCPYCDFNSHVRDQVDQNAWLAAYLLELNHYADFIKNKTLKSIFFGGGTPSLAEPKVIAGIIDYLTKNAGAISSNLEITLEANPHSVEVAKFKQLHKVGVNRISLGVQSFNPESLEFLGRKHNVESAKQALECAANTFSNYSFDLIYALPNSTVTSWDRELREALQYGAQHMSLYQLTIEKGTQFFADHRNGKFVLPTEEKAVQLYRITQSIMEESGMPAYEISNHAKPSYECQHNLVYWEYGDYVGIGPGAHGRYFNGESKIATMNIHLPEAWLAQVNKLGHGTQVCNVIPTSEIFEEELLMGLRLHRGISLEKLPQTQQFSNAMNNFIKEGFVRIIKGRLIATQSGILVLNHLIRDLITA